MAAMTAARYNQNLKLFYNRLKENGKHTTVAQIAVMRKLVIIAHSLFKSGESYDENKHLSYWFMSDFCVFSLKLENNKIIYYFP